MPTSAATARAARSLSPVSSTGRSPSVAQPPHGLGGGRLDRVGDDEHARRPGRPRRRTTAVRPARLGGLDRRGRQAACRQRRRRGRPTRRVAALDRAAHPEPGRGPRTRSTSGSRRRVRRPRPPGRPGAPRRPRRPRPAGVRRRPASPGRRDHVDQRHPPGGDRAGLVEHDGVDAAGGLEHLGAPDQDAELGAAAGADHQRGRRGQAQRARAGDDQHRDGGGERGLRPGAGAAARSRGCRPRARSRPARRPRRPGRPAAGPRPCRSAPPRPAGPSGRAGCRRRPGSRGRPAGRRR